MWISETAQCECGSDEQTPEHILQFCPHYEEARQEAWPQDTPLYTPKLWGNAEDLRRTAKLRNRIRTEDMNTANRIN